MLHKAITITAHDMRLRRLYKLLLEESAAFQKQRKSSDDPTERDYFRSKSDRVAMDARNVAHSIALFGDMSCDEFELKLRSIDIKELPSPRQPMGSWRRAHQPVQPVS